MRRGKSSDQLETVPNHERLIRTLQCPEEQPRKIRRREELHAGPSEQNVKLSRRLQKNLDVPKTMSVENDVESMRRRQNLDARKKRMLAVQHARRQKRERTLIARLQRQRKSNVQSDENHAESIKGTERPTTMMETDLQMSRA